jgi:hypothetical protein
MYKVAITYADTKIQIFTGITKISYMYFGEEVNLEGEEILNHKFPTSVDLHMTSLSSNYIASKDKLKTISIVKE